METKTLKIYVEGKTHTYVRLLVEDPRNMNVFIKKSTGRKWHPINIYTYENTENTDYQIEYKEIKESNKIFIVCFNIWGLSEYEDYSFDVKIEANKIYGMCAFMKKRMATFITCEYNQMFCDLSKTMFKETAGQFKFNRIDMIDNVHPYIQNIIKVLPLVSV